MSAPVALGEILAQKYRVDRVLGEGGMGVVVEATHLQLDQRVAIKFMLPDGFSNPEALARFQREARAAVRLRSQHVARVLDTGTFENGAPYIVMEYLEGTDLSRELEKDGRMSPQAAAEYVVQASDAIAEAHSLGIVHRDLKPSNLFLTRHADGSPLVKVLDFGISKATSLTDVRGGITNTSAVMGSPLYMSPEQIKSTKDVDSRTDVWSLGVILYQFLNGSPPFHSDTMGGIMAAVLTEAPAPLASLHPELSPQLCALVERCLQKDRSMRCQSVAELAVGLASFCPSRVLPLIDRIAGMVAGDAPSAAPRVPWAAPSAQGPTATIARSDLQPPPVLRSSTLTADGWNATGRSLPQPATGRAAIWSVAILLAVALGGAGAFVGLRGHGRVPESTTASAPVVPLAPPPSASEGVATPPVAASTIAPAASAAASSPVAVTTAAPVPTIEPAPVAPARPRRGHGAAAMPAAASASAPVPSVPTAEKPGILDTSN
jgi:serine/threonine-protein kinase